MTAIDPTDFPWSITPAPLPPEFDREQRAVDALLSASAKVQSTATPMGLSQRVFDASIAHADDLHREPLPAEFERDVRAVDAMLATASGAQRDDTPLGLAQRVYEVSVTDLPRTTAETAAPLRLVGVGAVDRSASRMSFRWSIWQRLSLAASVAIVGGIALWAIMQQPPAPRPVAHNPGAPNGNARLAAEISNQFKTLNGLTDDLSDFENQVAYLLDAAEVHSVADLNNNFDLSAQRIDM
jgi:hypothetical protein